MGSKGTKGEGSNLSDRSNCLGSRLLRPLPSRGARNPVSGLQPQWGGESPGKKPLQVGLEMKGQGDQRL